jgi:hypothetical protein
MPTPATAAQRDQVASRAGLWLRGGKDYVGEARSIAEAFRQKGPLAPSDSDKIDEQRRRLNSPGGAR